MEGFLDAVTIDEAIGEHENVYEDSGNVDAIYLIQTSLMLKMI